MQEILESARKMQDLLVKERRTLHRNPEVGMDLPHTRDFVLKELWEAGIEPQLVGDYGITALIGSGRKTVLLRADMDALPTKEKFESEYRSTNDNGHLCGHDMHTTMLLGAARLLKEKEDELSGCVKLMFQPGEEIGEGAKYMIKHGILHNPPVDAAIALHVNPDIPVGKTGYKKGFMSASIDAFFINIQGKGGHGSTPELSVDPLVIASHIQLMLDSLIQREIGAFEPAVLTVGKFGGGTVANVIPDTADVEVTLRCFNSSVREYVEKRVTEISENVCRALRGSCTVRHSGCPSVFVQDKIMDTVKIVLEAILGENNVEELKNPFTGSEDFSYISEKVPSVFFWLGAGEKSEYPLHNPNVVFSEDALWRGSAILASSAIAWLNEETRKEI